MSHLYLGQSASTMFAINAITCYYKFPTIRSTQLPRICPISLQIKTQEVIQPLTYLYKIQNSNTLLTHINNHTVIIIEKNLKPTQLWVYIWHHPYSNTTTSSSFPFPTSSSSSFASEKRALLYSLLTETSPSKNRNPPPLLTTTTDQNLTQIHQLSQY